MTETILADRILLSRSRRAAVVLTALLLTGCVVGETREAPPLVGRDRACASLDAAAERVTVRRAGTVIAESGDLAYDYGRVDVIATGDDPPSRSASYLDVWKTDGDGAWRLILDLWTPLPAKTDDAGD